MRIGVPVRAEPAAVMLSRQTNTTMRHGSAKDYAKAVVQTTWRSRSSFNAANSF
jgi:hypothetical protein